MAVILHDYLIKDLIDDEWIGDTEGEDDLEPESHLGASNQPDNRRRDEPLHHLSELEETTMN